MKFRIKIALCMIGLLALLFGIGGSALMAISFQNALSREQGAARESYELLITTLKVLGNLNRWTAPGEVSDAIGELSGQGEHIWEALRLTSENEVLYELNVKHLSFPESEVSPDLEHFVRTSFSDAGGRHYIQFAGQLALGKDTLTLSTVYDISPAYEMRSQQQSAYVKVFCMMAVLCAILSYSAAYLLTRPLGKLSRASRELASGNLDYRVAIDSNDEIGALSSDFDHMAGQVQKSVEVLQNAMEQQEMFMGSFAHELKTPMTSIIGYADLLRGQILTPEEAAEAANYIFSEGKRLESLSVKLLNLLMADHQEIKLGEVSPAELIEATAAQLRPVYESQGIDIFCHCEPGKCLLDGESFRVLLLNLMDNARKAFDGNGRIDVTLRMTDSGCRLSILDNGRGMPADALKHLTEAFYRVDKARSRRQGGVGLGLALCNKIVELHHGSIRFMSEQDIGTRVIVELKGGRL